MTRATEPDTRGQGDTAPDPADLLRHDMRAALADVLGGLELIRERDLAPRARTQLDRVRAAARQLARLLDRVDFGDAETAGMISPLAQLIRGVLGRWQGGASAIDVRLTADLAISDDLNVALSPLALERALGNLIDNALKYGARSELQVAATLTGAIAEVTVIDDGPGLSDTQRLELLEPGRRAAGDGPPGSGFGLHIARQVVVDAGGALTLEPGPGGRGLTARLRLPVADNGPAVRVVDGLALAGRSVLLVEDNLTNQLVAQTMLTTLGATVTLAADGIEGFAALADGPFDIALIDIEMPRRGGLQLIADIRAHDRAEIAEMPLVALTAYALPQHRSRILSVGGDGVIVKPLSDIAEFGAQVAAYLPAVAQRVPDGIDPQALNRLAVGLGAETFAELCRQLLDDLDATRLQLQAAEATNDVAGARAATHALVSLAGVTGAERLQQQAETLNRALHADPDGGILTHAGVVRELFLGIAEVEVFLRVRPQGKEAS